MFKLNEFRITLQKLFQKKKYRKKSSINNLIIYITE